MTTQPPTDSGDTPQASPATDEKKSLGSRVLNQSVLFGVLKLVSSQVTMISSIVLFNILGTRDFGAFDVGLMYVAFGQLIGDGGLAAALIRRKDDDFTPVELKTAFTTTFSVGVIFALSFFFATPWLAGVYEMTASESLMLRILAALFVFPSLWMVPYVRLERAIDYATIGKIELVANTVKNVSAVTIAWLGGGIFALVVAQVLFVLIRVVMAYRVMPGWYGFGWSWPAFKELITFGSKMQAVSFFIELKNRLSAGLISPWLGLTAGGLFSFALQYIRVPADLLGSVARVQFPAYARLERDDPELASLVANAMRIGLLVAFPVLAALALGASWLVPILYSDKWLPSIPVIWGMVPHILADIIVMQLIVFSQARDRAGLALFVYGLWSGLLWGGSALALWLYGDLTSVGIAHSIATLSVGTMMLSWTLRYLKHPVLPTVRPTLIAGILAWAPGIAIVTFDGRDLFAVVAILVYAGTFLALLLLLDHARTVRDLNTMRDNIRNKLRRKRKAKE